MCDLCNEGAEFQPAQRRRKIWELEGGWGCSIVGTCVSLADLRALARKLGLKPKPDFPVDYQLHGHFTSSLGETNKTAKLLNKLLDRKHAGAIRRFAKVRCGRELEGLWEDALEGGDIPGPYWAILTHSHTEPALAERMFADVHMLSHLVGASNRADIRVLQKLESENAQLRDDLAREKRRAAERTNEKQRIVDALAEEARAATQGRIKAEALLTRAQRRAGSAEDDDELRKTRDEAERQRERADGLQEALSALRGDHEQLSATAYALKAELDAVEAALPDADTDGPAAPGACAFNLNGRCILYVGGRSSYVCRLRALVEQWNGELLHHDGGIEKSLDELAGSVVRADAVVFPTDCVSHSAANKVKRLCRQTMKPYVPLRSSGVGSFVAGLQSALDQSPA